MRFAFRLTFGVAAVAFLALVGGQASAQLSVAAADPKVVVDGTYGLATPSSIPVLGKLLAQPAPNLAAKLASLRSALNASQPRLLPNVSGILAAKRANNATQADLDLKQNVRRAEGQTLNAAASAVENTKALGDPILFWNKVSTRVFANAATTGEQPGPVLGSRALSIVHLSIYDAYAGALGNPADLPRYLPQLEPASLAAKASPKAAIAGAAYEALLHLYPKQKAALDAELLRFCDGARGPLGLIGLQPSLVYGAYVANSICLQRSSDPLTNIAVPYASYTPPSTNLGYQYQPDPVTPNAALYAPYYGATAPLFAATQRFSIDPVASFAPPGSAVREGDYAALSTFGIASFLNETSPVNGVSYPRATRTPTQNITGTYWGYDGQKDLGTPPGLYNAFVRKVALSKGNTVSQNARLFAFVNAGMADAGTLIWNTKYNEFYQRPVTGVRQNTPLTGYLPRGSQTSNVVSSLQNWTPPFPAYPSGHTGFGTAAFQLVRLFYGVPAGVAGWGPDSIFQGDVVSGEFNGVTFNNSGVVRPLVLRGYKDGGLWKAILENAQSRLFLGVHWSYDSFFPKDGNPLEPDLTKNVGSLPLGLTVAEDIFAAGGGLAPKFVGTPVPLPPAPSSAGSQVASPPLSPIEGGLGGVVRAPRSAGTDYEPEPGLGEVSDLFVRPSSRN